jgi:hypothetical protein
MRHFTGLLCRVLKKSVFVAGRALSTVSNVSAEGIAVFRGNLWLHPWPKVRNTRFKHGGLVGIWRKQAACVSISVRKYTGCHKPNLRIVNTRLTCFQCSRASIGIKLSPTQRGSP